ncbi:MAG TPA: nodulation protein NfeD, partial [Thermoleophilia bacterium]|nr:nodulation protein NfeD [Thermoleophilia bacterium]
PNGARAASAGVYIMMGADVTAMAPQTNLGAATPVSLGGEMGETLTRKVINDSVAYIRALADEHGRNAEWAEQAVRDAESLPAAEAEDIGVIEFVAEDLDTLLQALDGFETVPKGLTLQTADAPIHRVEMNWAERFLHLVVNPNFAYIFLMVGVLGIVLELQSPGIGAGGIVGGISLLLGLYALSVLPVNLVGVALLVLAAILFVAEVFVVSGGILAIGGVAAMILGGMFLFDAPEGSLRVDWSVIIVTSLATLAFFAFVIRAVARARRQTSSGGLEAMVGDQGHVRQIIDPVGQVMAHGELWRAQADRTISVGSAVTVTAVQGFTLIVEQTADEDESPADGRENARQRADKEE